MIKLGGSTNEYIIEHFTNTKDDDSMWQSVAKNTDPRDWGLGIRKIVIFDWHIAKVATYRAASNHITRIIS